MTLPPGVAISPGRETTQIGPNNTNISGMIFTLTLPNQSTTTVFVPYALMTPANLPQIQQMFADRVAAINSVLSLGS